MQHLRVWCWTRNFFQEHKTWYLKWSLIDFEHRQSGAICASGIHVLQLLLVWLQSGQVRCNSVRFMMQIACLFVRWKQLSDARATALDAIILSCSDLYTTWLMQWWAFRNTAGSKVHFFSLEDMIHSNQQWHSTWSWYTGCCSGICRWKTWNCTISVTSINSAFGIFFTKITVVFL